MINTKKIAVLATAFAALAMTACGGGSKTSSKTLYYYCPETDTQFLAGLAKQFKEANPDLDYEIKLLSNVGEGDVKTELTKDLKAAADLFEIADDNIRGCVAARALAEVPAADATAYRTSDGEGAVAAFAVGEKVYGYPYRADNGYVLYYDKQIISDSQAATVEGIIAACEAAGAVFDWNITNGWYSPAPLFANGVSLYYDEEGNFNADALTSDAAKQAMLGLNAAWTGHVGTSVLDDLDTSKFGVPGTGRVGACIKWNDYDSFKTAVGEENVGVKPLPTLQINGVAKSLYSFQGYKGVAIKAGLSAEKLEVAQAFAKYITSENAQKSRLQTLGHGVSNKAVIAMTDLWTSPHLLALAEMTAAGHVVSQCGATNDNFWDAMTNLMSTVKNGQLTEENVAEYLLTCKTAIVNEE